MERINRRAFLGSVSSAALIPRLGTGPLSESVAGTEGDVNEPPQQHEPIKGINPELLRDPWSANWIRVPGSSPFGYGVYYFRRTFDLSDRPSSFVIHVSADNRYQLFVNGLRLSWGPARGDLEHWRFETVDIAPQLRPGRNVLAAVVWNFSEHAPQAQVTAETGFLLQGDTASERIVDTGPQWKCLTSRSSSILPVTHEEMRGYFVAGPGEKVDGQLHAWNWETQEFDDGGWLQAQVIGLACPRDARDAPTAWMLVPREIPPMEERPQRLALVRESGGVGIPEGFPGRPAALEVPPRTEARLLLDQSFLTTGFVELVLSGGKGSVVSLGYAEALYKNGGRQNDKGNRNDIDGKQFIGYRDVFVSDGGKNRLFRPLWWRTYRFIECRIRTGDEPLTIEDLRGIFTGYPFERKARLQAEVPRVDQILDVGWRTARLCAHETYMDCPYYEQLQYVGDTRIQCLISLYMTGDARLMRNAIAQINNSRTAEGATLSRAPTRLRQYIPSFSLWWIGMVYDYWMYQDDPTFVRRMLPGVRAVLSFFAAYQKPGGSLGYLPWWHYLDWAKEWRDGDPPSERDGSSAPFDLQLILALSWAAELEESLGLRALASEYRHAETELRATTHFLYWDAARKLYADTPRKKSYSQQTNVLAILADVTRGPAAAALMKKILTDKSLVQCTYFFRHYLHAALSLTGQGDRYLDLLGDWYAMLDRGLTTWAETPESAGNYSRSDCHAWSAHPNFGLFRNLLGIDSAAPGFKKVLIRPFLCNIKHVSGTIPHPKGEVSVQLSLRDGTLDAGVELPEGIEGELVWRSHRRRLPPGKSRHVV